MIRLLRFLFTGDWHLHKWKHVEKVAVYGKNKDMPESLLRVRECEHCGKIKSFKIG